MNQFYRALHMPPKRLLRKVMGEKEIYTIAVRPRPTAEGTEPLPALEGGPYTLLPRREGWWFADPLLYHRRGKRWLFAEAMDLSTGKGRLEVCELHDDGTADDWRVAAHGAGDRLGGGAQHGAEIQSRPQQCADLFFARFQGPRRADARRSRH